MMRCERKYGYGSRPDETRTNEIGWDVRNNLHYNGVGGSPLARYSTWVRFRLGRVGVILCYVGVELPYLGVWLEYDCFLVTGWMIMIPPPPQNLSGSERAEGEGNGGAVETYVCSSNSLQG